MNVRSVLSPLVATAAIAALVAPAAHAASAETNFGVVPAAGSALTASTSTSPVAKDLVERGGAGHVEQRLDRRPAVAAASGVGVLIAALLGLLAGARRASRARVSGAAGDDTVQPSPLPRVEGPASELPAAGAVALLLRHRCR